MFLCLIFHLSKFSLPLSRTASIARPTYCIYCLLVLNMHEIIATRRERSKIQSTIKAAYSTDIWCGLWKLPWCCNVFKVVHLNWQIGQSIWTVSQRYSREYASLILCFCPTYSSPGCISRWNIKRYFVSTESPVLSLERN